jgi:aryl-alcohol dehydrogenase-like predicted oxidoreductase
MVRVAGFCSSGGDASANREIIESGAFQCVQLVYNLFNPTEGRRPPTGFDGPDFGQTIEAAAEKGMCVVAIKALAGGPLGGSSVPHPLNKGSRTEGEFEAGVLRARALEFMEAEGEHTIAQAAVQYVLTNSRVSCALVGFSSVEQVEEAAWASDQGGLLPGDMSSIEDLYARDFLE